MNLPKNPLDWKVIDSTYALHEKWIKVRADQCVMPDGHEVSPFYVLEYPDWINVVAITENHQVILTRLYRHGVGGTILELPSGSVDKGENPLETARRELLEETGYVFKEIIQVAKVAPNPANHANFAYSFLALGGKKVSEQNLDPSEQIELVFVSLDQFKLMLRKNELVQAMHVTAAFYALQQLSEMDLGDS